MRYLKSESAPAGANLIGRQGDSKKDFSLRGPSELELLATQAARDLDNSPAEEVVGWAVDTFGSRFCVASSMTDAVLIHLVSRIAPGIEILFLETGLHFNETLQMIQTVTQKFDVRVLLVRPALTMRQQDIAHGPELYERDPDKCCGIRKVKPLEQALENYDAWASGLRRDESLVRKHAPLITFEASRGKIKVNPLASWTQAEVASYVADNEIPISPLFAQGYTSVGCRPCTRKIMAGEDARAGRWPLFDKTECGLHSGPTNSASSP